MIQDHAPVDDDCREDDIEQMEDVDREQHGEFDHHMDEQDVDWFVDTASESEEDDPVVEHKDVSALPAEKQHSGARNRVAHVQPEYIRLRDLGLSVRPPGCSLGIDPVAKNWRAGTDRSSHFSRSFSDTTRTSWQALIRVMELMLDAYLKENSNKHHELKLVRHQLARIRKLRSEEPPHKD